MCSSHDVCPPGTNKSFVPGGQTFLTQRRGRGTNIFNTWRGDKHFYIHGGHTFSSSGGSGNDDFDCDEEEDVSKANILARVLTVPEGPEILVYDNCHFMALYALC